MTTMEIIAIAWAVVLLGYGIGAAAGAASRWLRERQERD